MTSDPSNLPIKVAALYRFARFERFAEFRQLLVDLTSRLGIKGTLLLASEGINGTVAGKCRGNFVLDQFPECSS